MSVFASQYDALFVSNQKLKEISILLRNGRTVQSKVMNLIFTILRCIVLHIDNHCTRLHEFKDVFSDNSLTTLRNDLEDLLYFDAKFFNCLLLELTLYTLRKERNYLDRNIALIPNGTMSRSRWNDVIIRRKVKAIVKFMIFRKTRTCRCLQVEGDALNWSSYKDKIGVILNKQINSKNISNNRIVVDQNNCLKYSKDNYQRDIVDRIYFRRNGTNSLQNRSGMEYNLKDVYNQRFCNKIYCLFHYGWIWLSLYYFTVFFIQCYSTLREH
nr:uncharacterized protein LOC117603858 [Osmia lignaria]